MLSNLFTLSRGFLVRPPQWTMPGFSLHGGRFRQLARSALAIGFISSIRPPDG